MKTTAISKGEVSLKAKAKAIVRARAQETME
jgi:hypothetical protein